MIIKKIPAKAVRAKADHIRALTDYIRAPQMTNPEEKVGYSASRGFFSQSHLAQQAEMIALATEASRCRNPLLHWLVSWAEGENPTEEQIEEVVDTFLEAMEMQSHQLIYAVHINTENRHLHLALNRIDPATIRPVFPAKGFDRDLAHQVIARIEQTQGWRREPGALFRVDDTGTCFRLRERGRGGKLGTRVRDMENLTGERSLQRQVIERIVPLAANCADWTAFHWGLLKEDMAYQPRGRGAVIVRGEIGVKASVAGKALQLSTLERRWGTFQLPVTVQQQMGFRAVGPVGPPLQEGFPGLAVYLKKKQAREDARRLEQRRLRIRHEREAKANTGNLVELARQQRSERRALAMRYPRFPNFEDWLRQKAKRPDLAERWRYRRSSLGRPQQGTAKSIQTTRKENNAYQNRKRRLIRADRWRQVGLLFRRRPPRADPSHGHRSLDGLQRTAGRRRGDEHLLDAASRERLDRGAERDGATGAVKIF